jgi:peptidoglycan/LPS O-acetylase OafA/YrhL
VSDAPALPRAVDAPNLIPPPGNPRFPLIDPMRAIAALCVFAGHTVTGVFPFSAHPTLFVWAAELAYEGVAIFFLLSGFLLYRPFLTARRGSAGLRVGSYAKRRFLRIAPAYWVALSIFIAAGFVTGVTGGNWWIFYAFGQIYSLANIGHGIGVAWTLCIEVTFYAALPLFVLLCARLARRPPSLRPDMLLLVLLAAGSLGFRAHYSSFADVTTVSTLAGTFFWFALGMGLAILSVRLGDRRAASRGPAATGRPAALLRLWPVAAWIVGVGLFVLNRYVRQGFAGLDRPGVAVITQVLYGLAALLILLPAVLAEHERGPVQGVLRVRVLAWVGLISYAIYLYHTIVIDQLRNVFDRLGGAELYAAVAVTSLLVTLACASASYYLLERPLMRWGRSHRLWPRAGVPRERRAKA